MLPFRTVSGVDLNCDLGELETDAGLAQDAAIIPLITSANVACGEHAGSPDRMRAVARLCKTHNVAFGAHPGFADREHFGRRVVPMSPADLVELLVKQIQLASVIAAEEGIMLTHVKPHGALYNLAADNPETARAVIDAITLTNPTLLLYALSGSELESSARASGIAVVSEVFADRAYEARGRLVNRDQPGAVFADPSIIARRAASMLRGQCVTSSDGELIPLRGETLCVHGDTPDALAIVRAIRNELAQEGIRIARPEANTYK